MALHALTSRSAAKATAGSVGDVMFDGTVFYRKTGAAGADSCSGMGGWEPLDTVTPYHFMNGVDSPTAEQTAEAIRSAVNYASRKATLERTDGPDVDLLGHTFEIDRPIWLSGMSNVTIKNGTVMVVGTTATWTAGSGADWIGRPNRGEAMFIVNVGGGKNASNIRFVNMGFEANHIAPGFVSFINTIGGCSVVDCRGHGPKEFGILALTKNGDLTIRGNNFAQYHWGEGTWETTRTATLIDVRSTDHRVLDNTLMYCGLPLSISVPSGVVECSNNKCFNDSAMVDGVQTALPCAHIRARSGRVWSNYWGPGVVILEKDEVTAWTGGLTGGVLAYRGNYHIHEHGEAYSGLDVCTRKANSHLGGLIIAENTFDETTDAYTSGYDVTFTGVDGGSLASTLRYRKQDNLTARRTSSTAYRDTGDARFNF